MTNDIELKQCPFCEGNVEVKTLDSGVKGRVRFTSTIRCYSCFVAPYIHYSASKKTWAKEGALSKWNTRPIEDKLKAENEQLKAKADLVDKLLNEDIGNIWSGLSPEFHENDLKENHIKTDGERSAYSIGCHMALHVVRGYLENIVEEE